MNRNIETINEMRQKGYTLKEIGTEYGVTGTAIAHWIRNGKLPSPTKGIPKKHCMVYIPIDRFKILDEYLYLKGIKITKYVNSLIESDMKQRKLI